MAEGGLHGTRRRGLQNGMPLSPYGTGTPPRGVLPAGALRALTGRVTNEGSEQSSREPKTAKEVYKETYRTLLRFCNVTEDTDVAPIWPRLANCTKGEQMTVMVQEFQKVCNARGLATDTYTPIVTSALKQMILGFQFVGHGVDDLSTGCQPFFMVTYSGYDNQFQALETADVWNQLAQGKHSAANTYGLSHLARKRESEGPP